MILTETLPHFYCNFMTSLSYQDYPPCHVTEMNFEADKENI